MGARPLTPRVHYEEIREPEPGRAERYALRIARLEVPPGDAWAPPAVVRVETNGDGDGEASQQARVEERPAPHRVLGRTDMVDRATWLARALEPPLLVTPLEGQSVVISQTRDYVYPVRFEASDAGLLHRTLSTESLGMKVELKVHAVGEPAGTLVVEWAFWESRVSDYEKVASRQWLPRITRESASGRLALGKGEGSVLMVGGHRWSQEGAGARRGFG